MYENENHLKMYNKLAKINFEIAEGWKCNR